jgi:hypothetical protein
MWCSKRLALLLILFAAGLAGAQCSSTSYGNGFTCVAQATSAFASGSGTTQTATITATAGHQLLAFASACANSSCNSTPAGITMTPSTNQSDSFIAAPGSCYSNTSGFEEKQCIWEVIAAVGGSTTLTVTCGSTCWFEQVAIEDWTGMDATAGPFDSGVGAGAQGSGTTATVSPGTSTNAVDLVVAYTVDSNNAAITPGSGFTEIAEVDTSGTAGGEFEAKSVTATGAQTCNSSWTGSASWAIACAAIKAPSRRLPLIGVGP